MKHMISSSALSRLRLTAICITLAFCSPAKALDLGMTPNHVFELWTSINALLPKLARFNEVSVVPRMKNFTVSSVSNKSPSDVYEQVRVFRLKVDSLLSRHRLVHTDINDELFTSEKHTPSDVFLKSGHVLDALVVLLVSQTDANELISGYYQKQAVSGKTPNDVFALVDMANRKIDLLVE